MTQYIVLPVSFENRAHSEVYRILQVDNPEEDSPPVFTSREEALDWQIYLEGEYGSPIASWEIFELLLVTDLNFMDKKEAIATWLSAYANCIIGNSSLFTNRTFSEDAKEIFDLIMAKE